MKAQRQSRLPTSPRSQFPHPLLSGFWLCLVSQHLFFSLSLCRVLGAVFTGWTGSFLSAALLLAGFLNLRSFPARFGKNENTAQEGSTSRCLCQFTSGSGCTAGPHSSQDQLHVLSSPSVHWSREPCTQGKGLSSTDCQSRLGPSGSKNGEKGTHLFPQRNQKQVQRDQPGASHREEIVKRTPTASPSISYRVSKKGEGTSARTPPPF